MKGWKTGVLSAIVLVTVAAGAWAQAPGMTAWWDRPVVRNLGLTEDQSRRIKETVRESRDRLIQLRGGVESAEAELRDQMSEEKVDSAKAEAAIDRVVAARSELMRAVSRMSLKLRLILTAAQWQELERREGAGFRGGRLPGGRQILRPQK